jgi:hypothetical protein
MAATLASFFINESAFSMNSTADTNCNDAGFNYPDFSSVNDLNLSGDARKFETSLRLTPAISNQSGSAWYSNAQSLACGFETSFRFQITNPTGNGADGFAFVIQNNDDRVLGEFGESMGYGGIENSIAIEFDVFQNPFDLDGNHISVQTNGIFANNSHPDYSLGSTSKIPDISDGNSHRIKIIYSPGSLEVYLDEDDTAALIVPVDISSILNLDNGKAWVGFTAATGLDAENHDILNWDFNLTNSTVYLPAILNNYCGGLAGSAEHEPNDSSSQANGPLCSGFVYSGGPDEHGSGQDSDYYYINLTTAGTISIDVMDFLTDGQVQLYYQTINDPNPTIIRDQADGNYHIMHNGNSGLYYIRVVSPVGHVTGNGNYLLRVTYP